MSEFLGKFLVSTERSNPNVARAFRQGPLASIMVSPHVVKISQANFKQCKIFIETVFKLRCSEAFQKHVLSTSIRNKTLDLNRIGNYSMFMSYDFHFTEEGPKLIEINTNAAGSTLAYFLKLYHNISWSPFISDGWLEEIRGMISDEFRLFQQTQSLKLNEKDLLPKCIAILDEEPKNQKTYFEFLAFKEIFEQWKLKTYICDVSDLKYDENKNVLMLPDGQHVDFVYDRFNDFLLSEERSKDLRRAFDAQSACFSPNPFEYELLADKSRHFDLLNQELWQAAGLAENERETLKKTLLQVQIMSDSNAEEIWKNRKKLFFKPMQSYGGRAAYRGEKVSSKVFQEAVVNSFVAQEYAPAPELPIDGQEPFKYDVRFFVYKDQIQAITARLFRGQVTNFRAEGGGFAAVAIEG